MSLLVIVLGMSLPSSNALRLLIEEAGGAASRGLPDDDSPRALSPEPPFFVTITDPRSLQNLPRSMLGPRQLELLPPARIPFGEAENFSQKAWERTPSLQLPSLTLEEVMNPQLVLNYSIMRDGLIQSTIETMPEFKPFLKNAFRRYVCVLARSPHGHHVVRAVIENWPAVDVDFIVEELGEFEFNDERGIGAAAKHEYGTQVVLALLAHGALGFERVHQLMEEIDLLSFDHRGHRVVEKLIQHNGLLLGETLVKRLENLFYTPLAAWTPRLGHRSLPHLRVLLKEWDVPSVLHLRKRWTLLILTLLQDWIRLRAAEVKAMLADPSGYKLVQNALFRAKNYIPALRKLSEKIRRQLLRYGFS